MSNSSKARSSASSRSSSSSRPSSPELSVLEFLPKPATFKLSDHIKSPALSDKAVNDEDSNLSHASRSSRKSTCERRKKLSGSSRTSDAEDKSNDTDIEFVSSLPDPADFRPRRTSTLMPSKILRETGDELCEISGLSSQAEAVNPADVSHALNVSNVSLTDLPTGKSFLPPDKLPEKLDTDYFIPETPQKAEQLEKQDFKLTSADETEKRNISFGDKDEAENDEIDLFADLQPSPPIVTQKSHPSWKNASMAANNTLTSFQTTPRNVPLVTSTSSTSRIGTKSKSSGNVLAKVGKVPDTESVRSRSPSQELDSIAEQLLKNHDDDCRKVPNASADTDSRMPNSATRKLADEAELMTASEAPAVVEQRGSDEIDFGVKAAGAATNDSVSAKESSMHPASTEANIPTNDAVPLTVEGPSSASLRLPGFTAASNRRTSAEISPHTVNVKPASADKAALHTEDDARAQNTGLTHADSTSSAGVAVVTEENIPLQVEPSDAEIKSDAPILTGFSAASGRKLSHPETNDDAASRNATGQRLMREVMDELRLESGNVESLDSNQTPTAAFSGFGKASGLLRAPGLNLTDKTATKRKLFGNGSGMSGEGAATGSSGGPNKSPKLGGFAAASGKKFGDAPTADQSKKTFAMNFFKDILEMPEEALLAGFDGAVQSDVAGDEALAKDGTEPMVTENAASTSLVTPVRSNTVPSSSDTTTSAKPQSFRKPTAAAPTLSKPRGRPFKPVMPTKDIPTEAGGGRRSPSFRKSRLSTTYSVSTETQTDLLPFSTSDSGNAADKALREPLRWLRNLASRGLIDLSSPAALQRSLNRQNLYDEVELQQIMEHDVERNAFGDDLERRNLTDWSKIVSLPLKTERTIASLEESLDKLKLCFTKRVAQLMLPDSRSYLMPTAQRKLCRQLMDPSLISRLSAVSKTAPAAAAVAAQPSSQNSDGTAAAADGKFPARVTIPVDLIEVYVLAKTPMLYAERMPHGGPLIYRTEEDERVAENIYQHRKHACMQAMYRVVREKVYGAKTSPPAASGSSGARSVDRVSDMQIEQLEDIEQLYELLTFNDDPLSLLVRATTAQLQKLKPLIEKRHRAPVPHAVVVQTSSAATASTKIVPKADRLYQIYEQVAHLHDKNEGILGVRNVSSLCRMYVLCLHSFAEFFCRYAKNEAGFVGISSAEKFIDNNEPWSKYWFGKENNDKPAKSQQNLFDTTEKLRQAVDACHAVITIWRPDQELCEQLPERACLQVFGTTFTENQRRNSAADLLLLPTIGNNKRSSNVDKQQQQLQFDAAGKLNVASAGAVSNKNAASDLLNKFESAYKASQIITLNGSTKQMRLKNMATFDSTAGGAGSGLGSENVPGRSSLSLGYYKDVVFAYHDFLIDHKLLN